MNYYNPYYFTNSINSFDSPRLFTSFFSRNNFNLSSVLNGVQRTLGLVNQAIPIIKEAAPMMKNARTMFKVMNEFKKIETPTGVSASDSNPQVCEVNESNSKKEFSGNDPVFFI